MTKLKSQRLYKSGNKSVRIHFASFSNVKIRNTSESLIVRLFRSVGAGASIERMVASVVIVEDKEEGARRRSRGLVVELHCRVGAEVSCRRLCKQGHPGP